MRPVFSIAIATASLLAWGMIFWGVLFDFVGVYRDLGTNDGTAIETVLFDSNLESGAYFYPWPRTAEHAERWLAQHSKGPFWELHYSREGVNPQSPAKFLLGTLQYTLVSFLAWVLLRMVGPIPTGRRFLVVLAAGAMGTMFIQLGRPIWFHLPWHYSIAHAGFEIGSWLVVAAALSLTAPAGGRPVSA